MPRRILLEGTLEGQRLKRRINLEILEGTNTITTHDIPLHLAHITARYLLWILQIDYATQRDEFQMAKNALLNIPDIKRRWLTFPRVWNEKEPPVMSDGEAREFAIDGIRECIECRRDASKIVERTEEWKRRWGAIEPSKDEEWEEKARKLMEEWEHPC